MYLKQAEVYYDFKELEKFKGWTVGHAKMHECKAIKRWLLGNP